MSFTLEVNSHTMNIRDVVVEDLLHMACINCRAELDIHTDAKQEPHVIFRPPDTWVVPANIDVYVDPCLLSNKEPVNPPPEVLPLVTIYQVAKE